VQLFITEPPMLGLPPIERGYSDANKHCGNAKISCEPKPCKQKANKYRKPQHRDTVCIHGIRIIAEAELPKNAAVLIEGT